MAAAENAPRRPGTDDRKYRGNTRGRQPGKRVSRRPWERGRRSRGLKNDFIAAADRNNARVIYCYIRVAMEQEPQMIVVQQPPMTRIVEVNYRRETQPEPRIEQTAERRRPRIYRREIAPCM